MAASFAVYNTKAEVDQLAEGLERLISFMKQDSMTIEEVQDEIIGEFSLLDGDMEMTIFYIMELGQKLPVMDGVV